MDSKSRKVERLIHPHATSDGAGVKLKRSIGSSSLDYLDPFLLFDHFGSENPDDYIAGFPMHPHRGIETVTYMIAGVVQHRDSLGHSGTIGPGDIQWMTAGSGILHEEMPQLKGGRLNGFQLWINLPAKLKMSPPRYQEYTASQIPEISQGDGVKIKVLAGSVDKRRGPISEIAGNPTYLDISIPAQGSWKHPIPQEHSAFAYVFEGEGKFGPAEGGKDQVISQPNLIVLGEGDYLEARAGTSGLRFLLISGQALKEPITRYGPFVMNTEEEIMQAVMDLKEGTFVK